jgi:hypothetical protein
VGICDENSPDWQVQKQNMGFGKGREARAGVLNTTQDFGKQ